MRLSRILLLMAALVLVVSCGQSEDQKAVEEAYNQVVDALESGDGDAVYEFLSSNTRDFLDRLAGSMADMGLGEYDGGGDMLTEFLGGEEFAEFSRDVSSITVEGDVATLDTGTETLTFLREGDSWGVDLEGMIREGMEEGLEGTGITVEDVLEGNIPGMETGGGQSYESGEGTAPVTIINGLGSWDIYFVYVDPSNAPWGEDRLGANILSPGDELTVWVEPGTYDMKVEDVDSDTYTLWGVDVDENGYVWEVTLSDMDAGGASEGESGLMPVPEGYTVGDGTAPVTFTNSLGGWDIYAVLIDPSSDPEWGDERLGAEYMLGGDQTVTVMVEPGTYDIQVTDEDGDTYTKWEVAVGANGYEWEVTLADLDATGSGEVGLMPVPEDYTVGQGSAPVTFTNDLGGWDIYGVRIDPSSEPEWGEERLGAEYLLTGGQSVTVMVDPGTYDMQVIDEDEDTYTKWEVVIGEEGYDWSVTLSDLD